MTIDATAVHAPAIYARVSSDEQVGGTSLDDQVDKCLKQAAVYGWQVPPEQIFIDDGYSGASLDRPAMTRLRAAVRAGAVDCVLVYKLDRLSRNIRDTVNLVLQEWSREHRVVFRSVSEDFNTNSPLGTLIFSILASFAHFERDVIRDRTENGRRRRFAQGRRAAGDPPFGYRPGPDTGTMVVDPDQAAVVARIFDLYLRGHGFMKIATELNALGIRSATGRDWTDKTVRDVLINEVYTGKVKYGGAYAPGLHAAIIDPDTFRAAQQLRRSRERVGGRSLGSPFLLAGLVHCRGCGHLHYTQPATASRRRRKDGTAYVTHNRAYYLCGGRYKRGRAYCACGHIPKELLEEHVVARLRRRFGGGPDVRQAAAVLQQELAAHARELQADLERLTAAICANGQAADRWATAFERGELDPQQFGHRVARLQQERADLDRRRAELAAALAAAQQRRVNQDWLARVSRQVDNWAILPAAAQQQLVRCLVERILVWRDPQAGGSGRSAAGGQAEDGAGAAGGDTGIVVDIVWNRSEQSLPAGDREAADLPAALGAP